MKRAQHTVVPQYAKAKAKANAKGGDDSEEEDEDVEDEDEKKGAGKQSGEHGAMNYKVPFDARLLAAKKKQDAKTAFIRESYSEAITLCTEAIEMDPRDADLLSLRSSAYAALGAKQEKIAAAMRGDHAPPRRGVPTLPPLSEGGGPPSPGLKAHRETQQDPFAEPEGDDEEDDDDDVVFSLPPE